MPLIDNFERLSFSSVSVFKNAPDVWCARYLFNINDTDKPAAWRGSAVEKGLETWLHTSDADRALEVASTQFEHEAQGELADHIDAERSLVGPMTEQAITAFHDGDRPNASQLRIEHWLDGVPLPFLGYIDFTWDDWLLDLKTSKQCPSSPRADHAMQVALYHAATGKTPKLLYVTAKKHALYEVEDTKKPLTDLRKAAQALCYALGVFNTPTEMARAYAPNFDSFYWSEQTKREAERIWT